MGRVQSSSGLGKHDMMTQSEDGSFFLEPMLTMVISHCEKCGSGACTMRIGLLKTTKLT